MSDRIAVKYPVYRHGSDDVSRDCGRACAQMVIASLVRGAQNASPTTSVPETQQSLRARETYEAAHAGAQGPGGWETFPDELVDLLKNSADLTTLMQNSWHVVGHSPSAGATADNDQALQDLLAEIVAGLKLGKPAILNMKAVDHWVVVSKAWVNDDGSVEKIKYVDPAGLDTGITGAGHRYTDACHSEGADYWLIKTSADLADFELAVGNVSPRKYAGKYLAIVPDGVLPAIASKAKKKAPKLPAPILGPAPDVQTGLLEVAADLGLDELKALLDTNPDVQTRVVKDIQGSSQQYLLGSLFDTHGGQGLIGAFNVRTNRVSRFRLTLRSELHRALIGVPAGENLWWTRRRLTTWSLPFYPFQQIGPGIFRRLGDGQPLVYMPNDAGYQ